jgi:hypothetical protein
MGAGRSVREELNRGRAVEAARDDAATGTAPRSGALLPAQVLALQAAAGNAAVSRAVRAGRIRSPRLRLARLVKNPFTDAAAWKDAAGATKAVDAYVGLSAADRFTAVKESYTKHLAWVLGTLPKADQAHKYRDAIREITRLVEEIETRASAGLTDDQIATTQRDFLKKQAEDAAAAEAAKKAPPKKGPPPKPTQAEVEQQRKKQVESTSIPPPKPSGWDAMAPKEQKKWTDRAKAAVAKVVAHAKAKHPEIGLTDKMFRIAFKDVESRGANVVAFGESDGAGGTRAAIGFAFVTAVELNPAYVMDVVVHEVSGHPEYGTYGTEYHLALYDAAMAKTPGYVKPAAGSAARRSEIDAYAYQETEMYSVLRSMPYRTGPAPADVGKVPNLDTQVIVTWRVGLMKKQWAPALIVPILRGFKMRLVIDPRITGAAMNVFFNAVKANFDAATATKINN